MSGLRVRPPAAGWATAIGLLAAFVIAFTLIGWGAW